jgi:hypothetical protein
VVFLRKLIVLVCVLSTRFLYGQADTLTLSNSGSGSGTISIDLTLSSPAGSEPAAIQWTVGFPASDVMWASVVPGPAAVSAGKSITCAIDFGAYTCVASGTNATIITNGVVASVTLTLAPGLTSTSTNLNQTIASNNLGASIGLAAAGGSVGGGAGGSGPPVSSLGCTPSNIAPGTSTTCTVTLAIPAPPGGAIVALASGTDYVNVPPAVAIAAGSISAIYTATAMPNAGSLTATLTARSGGSQVSTPLNVSGVGTFSITCSPATVPGTDSSSCAVSLPGPAPSGGATIALSSNSSVVTVPATATIPAGSASTTITAKTSSATRNISAVITASYSGISQTAPLNVVPVVPLSSLTCTLPTVTGTPMMGSASSATCKLSLASSAAAAESFSLTTASPITSPPSVSVPSGSSSATFTINSATLPTKTGQTVTLTASGYGVSKIFTINVSILVSSLTCSPVAISFPQSSATTCTITMTQAVPISIGVPTSTDNEVLSIPTSVGILAGTSVSTFLASTTSSSYALVTVTASAHGVPQTFVVSVGNVPVKSLTCSPTHLTVGSNSTCTVTLVGRAPAGGETIHISSSSSKLSTPAFVALAGGVTSGTFKVTALTGYVGPVVVTARAGGASATATVSAAVVRPRQGRGGSQPPITSLPQSLSCSPKMAQAGSTVTCEIQLSGPAQDDARGIALSASSASVRVPARIRSRPRQSSLSFQASVDTGAALETVAIQASLDDALIEDDITVVAARRPILSVPGKQYVTVGRPLAFQVRTSSRSGGPLSASLASVPPGAEFESASGTFQWVPGESGTWKLTFLAPDAADPVSADVVVQAGTGVPLIEEMRNTGSGSAEEVCSPASMATLRGGWLSSATVSDWSGESLELGGTAVEVNGSRVPVLAASPTEVTFECPNASAGTVLTVAVETASGRSGDTKTIMRESTLAALTVPGLMVNQAAAVISDSELAMPRNYRYEGFPAQPEDLLRIPVTGFSGDPEHAVLSVMVGDIPLPARSVLRVPGLPGISYVEIVIPSSAPIGDVVPLRLQQHLPDGRVILSQTASIAVEAIRQ